MGFTGKKVNKTGDLINWFCYNLAQWQHILQSNILAMDEVPIKAGRTKGAGWKPGHMKQTYFWPLYGDSDEVAFTWCWLAPIWSQFICT